MLTKATVKIKSSHYHFISQEVLPVTVPAYKIGGYWQIDSKVTRALMVASGCDWRFINEIVDNGVFLPLHNDDIDVISIDYVGSDDADITSKSQRQGDKFAAVITFLAFAAVLLIAFFA